MIFVHKKLRPRQSEPINTLLDITYHKQVFVSVFHTGNRRQQCFLYIVAVLILIDHNFPILLLIFQRSLRQLLCLRIHQYTQCIVLHIRKIQHIFLLLFFIKTVRKRLRQRHQHPHHFGRLCQTL